MSECTHPKVSVLRDMQRRKFVFICDSCGERILNTSEITEQPQEVEMCGGAQTVQRNCLQEADQIINGERQDMYGSPEDSFEIIAGYWNVFLREKIRVACHKLGMDKVDIPDLLTPLDTTNMQVLFKQARKLGQKPCRDNYVDSCGYEAIGADRLMKESGEKKLDISGLYHTSKFQETLAEAVKSLRGACNANHSFEGSEE